MVFQLSDPTAAVSVFFHAMALSLGLIVAIGAQNAFVLRQGLRRQHVAAVVVFCAAADALLISAGVLGMAQALGSRPWLAQLLAAAGAVFLALYGWRAWQRSRQAQALQAAQDQPNDRLWAVLAQAAGFTLLNPHVYLDTMLLVGSMGAQQPGNLQCWFIAGASAASVLWFIALGFGARWLAPWFAKPQAWQWLDRAIAFIMFSLSLMLCAHLLRTWVG